MEMIYSGKNVSIILPSGRMVDFREPNANDEEILSNLGYSKDNVNLVNYISSIVTKDYSIGSAPTPDQVLDWHKNDIYYFLLAQRVEVHGAVLNFKSPCSNPKCTHKHHDIELEENLRQEFMDDMAKPTDKPKKYQITKYPLGAELETTLTLSSGKSVKFNILTGKLEKNQLAIPQDAYTKNTPLSIRNLSYIDPTTKEAIPVKHFGLFSLKDTKEIRAHMKKVDPFFEPQLEFDCPACGTPHLLPLFACPAFYYPEEGI